MEWHLPSDKPSYFTTSGLTGIVFCNSLDYYIGKTGPDRKWYVHDSDKVLDEIDAWAFLPEEPANIQNVEDEQDWIKGNGPVSYGFTHCLLYDHDEILCSKLSEPYFDNQNRTFPDISHHIILPSLPLRLAGRPMINKQVATFLQIVRQRQGLFGLVVDPFNEACLFRAVKELYNTTTNGVRRFYLLEKEQLAKETVSRWAFQANNGLNKAEARPYINDPFGVLAPPADLTLRNAAKAVLDAVVASDAF